MKEYVEDTLVLGDVKSIAKLYVTLLFGVDIVLGYSWLQENGAVLHFKKLTISQMRAAGSSSMVTKVAVSPLATAAKLVSTVVTSLSKVKDGLESNSNIETLKAVSNKQVGFGDIKSKASKPNNIPVGEPTKWIATESLTCLCAVLNSNGDDHDMDDIHGLLSFDERWKLTEDEVAGISKQVPPGYIKYINLFHPQYGTEVLPPHRLYDLRINLEQGAKLHIAALYEMNPDQFLALKEMLDRKGKDQGD